MEDQLVNTDAASSPAVQHHQNVAEEPVVVGEDAIIQTADDRRSAVDDATATQLDFRLLDDEDGNQQIAERDAFKRRCLL